MKTEQLEAIIEMANDMWTLQQAYFAKRRSGLPAKEELVASKNAEAAFRRAYKQYKDEKNEPSLFA